MLKTLGMRLSEARKNAGLTQAQVAEKLCITTQSVSGWECGNSAPDIEKLPELASLYGVTADWLLAGRLPAREILEVTADLSDRLFSEKRMATYIGAYCNAKQFLGTMRALAYAKRMHSGQFRKPGHSDKPVPYIYHPLLITCHALALGLEEDDLLSACLLHDVCEDCGVSPEDLPVSEEARQAIILLTKAPDFVADAEHRKAYFDGIASNRIATMVKLLDRCNNISSMATSFSDKKIAAYIQETQEYVRPLMEHARDVYPQYSNQLFLIRYHMNSVTEALRHHMLSTL